MLEFCHLSTLLKCFEFLVNPKKVKENKKNDKKHKERCNGNKIIEIICEIGTVILNRLMLQFFLVQC